MLSITVEINNDNSDGGVQKIKVDDVYISQVWLYDNSGTSKERFNMTAIIPPGSTYELYIEKKGSLTAWYELK